jgi:sulfoxide reductase catalytic subunit YedY
MRSLRLGNDIPASEITPEDAYLNRREFLAAMGIVAATAALPRLAAAAGVFDAPDEKTPLKDITHYNNFGEFGWEKTDPAEKSGAFRTRPWAVAVDGECAKPRTFGIDELLRLFAQEERVYRMRCIEGWSMVIPWTGFPLAALLKRVEPTGKAKFVEFTSAWDPAQMPGDRRFPWPYTEGLRIDEAMHPLVLLVTGLYGKTLPTQDGAPIRLAVPWKFGIKSAKSLVRIRLVQRQPLTSWCQVMPQHVGFYSNVNPKNTRSRWEQALERRLGELRKRDTVLFNGYGAQVAALYEGMDLQEYF